MNRQSSLLSFQSQQESENTYFSHYKSIMENQKSMRDKNKSIDKKAHDQSNISNSIVNSQILQQQNQNIKSSSILQPKYSFSNLSTCNLPLSQQNTARNRSDSQKSQIAPRDSLIALDIKNENQQYFQNLQSMKLSNQKNQQISSILKQQLKSQQEQQHQQQQEQEYQQQIQQQQQQLQQQQHQQNNFQQTKHQSRNSFQSISSTSDSSCNYLKKLEQFKQEQLEKQSTNNTNIYSLQSQNSYNNLKNKSIKDKSLERNNSCLGQQSFGQQNNQFKSKDSFLCNQGKDKQTSVDNYVGLDNQILIKNYTFNEIENVIKELNCKCGYKTDIREVLTKFGEKFQDLRKKRDKLKEKNKQLKEELNQQFKDKKLLEMQVNYEGFISQVNTKLEEKEKQLQRIQTEIKLKESELKLRQDEIQNIKLQQNKQSQNNTFSAQQSLMSCSNCETLSNKLQQEQDIYFEKSNELQSEIIQQKDKVRQLEKDLAEVNQKYEKICEKQNDYDQMVQDKNELNQQIIQLNDIINEQKIKFEREKSSVTMKIQEIDAQKAIVKSDERLLQDRERILQEKEDALMEQVQQVNYHKQQLEKEKEKFEIEKNNFYNEAQKIEEEMKKKEDNIQLKYYVTNQNNNLQNTSSKKNSNSQYLNNPNLLASPPVNQNNLNGTANLNQNNHHQNSAQSNNISMNSMKFLFNCSGMEADDEEMELKMIALKMNEEMISKKIEMQVQEMIKQKEKLDKREKELRRLEERLNGPSQNHSHNSSTNYPMNNSSFHRSSKKKL
ncbi:hypothetical protein ABPG74_022436 [Tetrahymena malaccensis]